jgi:hypothetical protein
MAMDAVYLGILSPNPAARCGTSLRRVAGTSAEGVQLFAAPGR